jgi:hypothetical protein
MEMESDEENPVTDIYGDDRIKSRDAKVDGWLKFFYIVLPIWGFIILALYWNGSKGWLDRGYWNQLQKAANTTYPKINYNEISKAEIKK